MRSQQRHWTTSVLRSIDRPARWDHSYRECDFETTAATVVVASDLNQDVKLSESGPRFLVNAHPTNQISKL